MNLRDFFFSLIRETALFLPEDVEKAIVTLPDSPCLEIMKQSIVISRQKETPICQDTGFPYFWIKLPLSYAFLKTKIEQAIADALVLATQKGILRPNAVDSVTQENSKNNLGLDLPYIEWEFLTEEKEDAECYCLLKGGGSENVSEQYSLPFEKDGIQAGRDQKGILSIMLYHLQKIQGQGCSPGILGIGIGGDRASSMKLAKKQLFRELTDIHPDKELREWETLFLEKANQLEIGPMGLGGYPTLLAVKIGKTMRHPASFFVSFSYLCWVARRKKWKFNLKHII